MKKQRTFTLKDETHRKLKKLAHAAETSMSAWLDDAVEKAFSAMPASPSYEQPLPKQADTQPAEE